MVALELFVAINELEVRVLLAEAELNDLFILEEGEFLQGLFEMLDLAEYLGKSLVL